MEESLKISQECLEESKRQLAWALEKGLQEYAQECLEMITFWCEEIDQVLEEAI